MNERVPLLSSLVTAALVSAIAVSNAAARSVSVAAIQNGAATAAFGDADGATYTLAWGYGPADGGAATNAWAHFETLGEVAASATSRSVALPAGWGDAATHLRFFLLEPEIPAAATRVGYIEATGTQWINTGVNLCSNDTVVAEYEYPDPVVGKNNYLFGVYKQGMTAGYFYSNSGSYPLRFQKANGTSGATTTEAGINATPGARQTVTMKIGSGTTTIVSASGDTLYSGVLGGTIRQDATAPLALFTANISGSPSSSYTSAAKIYSFRIFDKNGALRLDFVPCTVNGDPALFDRVSGDYFYNGGSGSLATGAAMATPLFVAATSATASAADYGEPDEYLDYVQSSGSQWIDTGVRGRIGVEAELDVAPVTVNDKTVLGSRSGGSTHTRFYAVHWANGGLLGGVGGLDATDGKQYWYWGNRRDIIYADTRYTIHSVLKNGELSIAVNGKTIATRTDETSFDSGCNMYLFACNVGGTADSAYRSSARLYGAKIWFDGELVRHFIPCRKNNRAALYDKVSGRIFFPQGADLVAGPVLPRPVELVEWVQADGANGSRSLYVDTGVYGKSGVGMVADMEWATKPAGYGTNNIFCGATSTNSTHIWLYNAVADGTGANATHRFGYDTWKLQLSSNNVVRAGIRYRVESFQAKGMQSFAVSTNAPGGTWVPVADRTNNDADVISTEQTLYVFANNNAGTAEPVYAEARLYSLVLTNGLGVLRDFVPCVADNGRAGLYDRDSERVFFPQAAKSGATSNDFDPAGEIGAVTNVLAATANAPSARLSYVESNGTSDFVDLGIIGKDGIKMVAEMEWGTIDTSAHTFLGAAASSTSLFTTYRINDNQQRMGYANGSRTINSGTTTPVSGTRYRVTTTLDNGAQSLLVEKKVDGVWTTSGARTATDAGPMDTGLPLTLFARNLNGVPDEFAAARVYSLKLWQKNATSGEYELVRDLVPAKGPEGAAALYDRVSQTWFRNVGRYALDGGTESPWRDGFVFGVW